MSTYMADYETKLLKPNNLHLLDNFCCGNPEIDRYAKEDAIKDNENGKGVTYLIIDTTNDRVVAYYTLASASLFYYRNKNNDNQNGNVDLKIHAIPSIEIKMFAVNRYYQDQVCSDSENQDKLISDVILGALIAEAYWLAMETLGFEIIILHSVEDAVPFYLRNNFEELKEYIKLDNEYIEGCIPMYQRLFDNDN